jgi:pimeloyl-ACP methyl ester carboxylesterase
MAAPPRTPAFEAIVQTVVSPDAELNLATRIGATERVYPPDVVGPEMLAKFTAIAMRPGPFVDRGGIRRMGHTNRDIAAQLTLPVTLVFGGRDPIVPAALAELLKQSIPKARVVTFDKAGHAPFIEAETDFNALLDQLHCSKR